MKSLFAKVIDDINTGLKGNLGWLNNAFGQAQIIIRNIDDKRYKLPCVYVGNTLVQRPNDYIEVTPNKGYGNFSFILLDDPTEIDWQPNQQGIVSCPFSIIFWFDLRTIYDQLDNRNIDTLKADILRELNGGFSMPNGTISINRVYERGENVYGEFTLDEVDNQYMMHPYGALRFEGTIRTLEPCYNE